jgi:5-methylthioribose kinase
MRLVDVDNLEEYLRSSGRIEPGMPIRVEVLGGGVSNAVFRVEPAKGQPFVIKQARERLRTEAPWFSRIERIWRETAVMSTIRRLLATGVIPQILFEDRENFLFAMEAVDPRHVVWKQELLAGRLRPEVAVRLAGYLAAIHRGTHGDSRCEQDFADREIFVELRVDPFYRHIARVHPELRSPIEALIDEMWRTRVCLVHADFSPKNVLLVDTGQGGLQITLVDFETGHYGDPAFDLGFFLSHLVLKAVHAEYGSEQFLHLAETFWGNYQSEIATLANDPAFAAAALERRTVAILAGCALARVDGTSPVDYLPRNEQRERVRRICRRVLVEGIQRLAAVYSLVTSI